MPGSTHLIESTTAGAREPVPAQPTPGAPVADAPRPPLRIQQLDVLRGIAVLLVLGRHRPVWFMWTRIGWVGVELFFVLSGFLVSGLLFHEYRRYGRIDVKRFYIRRGFKIYPAFYVFTLATLAYMAVHGKWFSPMRIIAEMCFFQNYHLSVWGHTWSLGVEEHFYLLLPLALLLLVRRAPKADDPFRALPWWCLAVGAAVLLIRYLSAELIHPFSYWWHIQPTHLKIDSLTAGVLLSYWFHFHRIQFHERMRRWWLPVAAVSVLLILPCFLTTREDPRMFVWGMTSLYLGFAGVIACSLSAKPELPEPWRRAVGTLTAPVAYIGTYSYSIYLWHQTIDSWGMVKFRMFTGLHLSPEGEFWVYLVWSLILGIVMAKLVEVPALRLRDRWFPSRSSAIAGLRKEAEARRVES